MAVAARPMAGGTGVFSLFSCEEKTWPFVAVAARPMAGGTGVFSPFFVAVAARPMAGGTGVFSPFSCEEKTCRKYSHGMLSF